MSMHSGYNKNDNDKLKGDGESAKTLVGNWAEERALLEVYYCHIVGPMMASLTVFYRWRAIAGCLRRRISEVLYEHYSTGAT